MYLESEFQSLATTIHVDLTKSNACMSTNKVKNRFNDGEAVPCESHANFESLIYFVFFVFLIDDKNRVRLISIPGVSNSDYINASFIDVRSQWE